MGNKSSNPPIKTETDLVNMGYMPLKNYAKSLKIDVASLSGKYEIIHEILKYKESVEPDFTYDGKYKPEQETKTSSPEEIKLQKMDLTELEKYANSLNIDLKNVENTKEEIIKTIIKEKEKIEKEKKKEKDKIEMERKKKEYEEYLKKQETNPDMKKKPSTPTSLKTDTSKLLEEYKEEIKTEDLIGVIKDIKESNKTVIFSKFSNVNGKKDQREIKLRPNGTGDWAEYTSTYTGYENYHHVFLHKGQWKIIGSEKLLMVGVLFRDPVPSDSDCSDSEPEKDGWLVNCGNWKHKNGMHSRIFTEKELSEFKISKS